MRAHFWWDFFWGDFFFLVGGGQYRHWIYSLTVIYRTSRISSQLFIFFSSISSGGYYCPAGTVSPKLCDYPYYCPPGSDSQQICDLGQKATTITKPRVKKTDACLDCPAGYYGNNLTREGCAPCPPGYYCPPATKDPNEFPCTKGFYCPPMSAKPVSSRCYHVVVLFLNFNFLIRNLDLKHLFSTHSLRN